MKMQLLKSLFALLPLSLVLTAYKPALANNWQYARDAVGDGLGSNNSSLYDIFGIGIKDDGNDIWVGVNANLGLEGNNTSQVCSGGRCWVVSNGNIGWGDLFFDFSGNREFGTSNDNRQLFGVRFAPGNDSKVEVGVYSNVFGVGVQAQNAGFLNFGRHYNTLPTVQQKQTTNVGDLAWNDPYWGSRYTYSLNREAVPNVIASGNRIGDVTLLDSNSLYAAGFDSGLFQGSKLFGFKFSRSLLPSGNFIASLFQECLNDAIALRGHFNIPAPPPPPPVQPPAPVEPSTPIVELPPTPVQDVPEPSGVIGLLIVSLLGVRKIIRNS